jgi:FkbM family methyltransferase
MYNKEYEVADAIDPSFIIDCGANIGLSAVWYANTYPNAKIIAIEPDINNFVFLKKNTKAYPNVKCLNKAVWPYETSMSIVDKGTGNWGLQTIESKTKTGNNIDAVSISTVMDQFQINFIDILKIDIEGAEKELFSKNYESWLSKTGVIAIELHDNIDKNISAVFYNAISGRKYKEYYNGENLICDFR